MDHSLWLRLKRNWVEGAFGGSADGQLLGAVLDSFERCVAQGRLDEGARETLARAMKRSLEGVWSQAISCACQFGLEFPEAYELLREHARAPDAQSRFHVCAMLDDRCFPRGLAVELLPALVDDKSKRVRMKAAEACMALGLKSMLPALDSMLARERSAEARRSIRCYVDILRDGKHVMEDATVVRLHPDGSIQ